MFGRKKKDGRRNIALFVDGPNIIRKEFSVNLDDLRRAMAPHGRIMIGKVFLNQFASEKLIEAISNQGFEPTIFLAGEEASDVDVPLAVDATKAIYNTEVDIIAIASRDADFLPVIQAAKEKGKQTIVVGMKPGFSKALQKSADIVKVLENNKRRKKQVNQSANQPT